MCIKKLESFSWSVQIWKNIDQHLRETISKNAELLPIISEKLCDISHIEEIEAGNDSHTAEIVNIKDLNAENRRIDEDINTEFSRNPKKYEKDNFILTGSKFRDVKKREVLKIERYVCIYCTKIYKQKKRLESHLKNHHQEETQNLSINSGLELKETGLSKSLDSDININRTQLVNCENCDNLTSTTFHQEPKNINHRYIKPKPVKSRPVREYFKGCREKRRFQCNYCVRKFTTKYSLKKHTLSHKDNLIEYNKKHIKEDTQDTHNIRYTVNHNGEFLECSKNCRTKENLKTHIVRNYEYFWGKRYVSKPTFVVTQ